MSDFEERVNSQLRRRVLLGGKYDKYIPFSDCSSVNRLGAGDTKYAIDNIKLTCIKYKHHTEVLAKEFFTKKDLKEVCTEIHYFLYNYFQYKLDGLEQKLRSPACSWSQRYKGIDCKSYTIFGSTILLNLGIGHYLRRIVQHSNPNGYTHIYIIVPKDQKGFDLSKGYYTIDGTINTMKELPYLQADDVFMEVGGRGLGNPSDEFIFFSDEDLDNFEQYANQVYDESKKKAQKEAVDKFNNWYKYVDIVGTLANKVVGEAGGVVKSASWAKNGVVVQQQAGASSVAGSSASAGTSSVMSVVGVVTCAIAVVGIATRVILSLKDPCKNTYYSPSMIAPKLKTGLVHKVNELGRKILLSINDGTFYSNISDINIFIKEMDLGVKNYKEAKKYINDTKCGEEVFRAYEELIDVLYKNTDALIKGFINALSDKYLVEIEEVRTRTKYRNWFFIVPNGMSDSSATYRRLKITRKDQKEGVYHFGDMRSWEAWLEDTTRDIHYSSGKEKADAYKKEMQKFNGKIAEIRKQIAYLPVVTLVSMEEPLQEEQYKIYLKYNDKYRKVVDEAQKQANKQYLDTIFGVFGEVKRVVRNKVIDEKKKLDNIMDIARIDAENKAGLKKKELVNLAVIGVVGLVLIYSLKSD